MASNKAGNKKPSIKFRPSLFWDVDPRTIDPQRNAPYIIERILDFGADSEVRWMTRYYSPALIKKVLRQSRVLHEKSKALWSLLFR